jgi:hypothetical protein
MCVIVNPKFKLTQLEPAEIPLNIISFLNANWKISKGRGVLVVIYKLHYAYIAFTMKMNSDVKTLCDNSINNQHINVLK